MDQQRDATAPRTGAERYFRRRLDDPAYALAYDEARRRLIASRARDRRRRAAAERRAAPDVREV